MFARQQGECCLLKQFSGRGLASAFTSACEHGLRVSRPDSLTKRLECLSLIVFLPDATSANTFDLLPCAYFRAPGLEAGNIRTAPRPPRKAILPLGAKMDELIEKLDAFNISTVKSSVRRVSTRQEKASKPPYREGLLGLPSELLNSILLLVSFSRSLITVDFAY